MSCFLPNTLLFDYEVNWCSWDVAYLIGAILAGVMLRLVVNRIWVRLFGIEAARRYRGKKD
tara:strand:- start:137 stop:319 length:183 start_codon:yes stop_codon:yes gene_type:complete